MGILPKPIQIFIHLFGCLCLDVRLDFIRAVSRFRKRKKKYRKRTVQNSLEVGQEKEEILKTKKLKFPFFYFYLIYLFILFIYLFFVSSKKKAQNKNSERMELVWIIHAIEAWANKTWTWINVPLTLIELG